MAPPQTPDNEEAVLTLPSGKTIKLPILRPSLGSEILLDVRSLQAHGVLTYDPGFTSTASCVSAITFLDGGEGVCLYRGHPVVELAEQSNYLDTCHLLFFGELPATERDSRCFHEQVMNESLVHERFTDLMKGFHYDAHPMAILLSTFGGLASFYPSNVLDTSSRTQQGLRIIAKFPTLAAMAYKTSIGQSYVHPRLRDGYAASFLRMMFETPLEEYVPDPVVVEALDAFLILHADHEQNASTSTVRTAGSSQANPYACIAAGCASLWGPMHGGANEAVVKMLEEIGTVENVAKFLEDVKNKVDGVRLMGFGHRVYKNFDPRATFMKKLAHKVLDHLSINDPKLALAVKLEETALSDQYFVKRKLYPNVDFYSGIMLKAIGIPTSMYTVLFAMARSIGWLSQWNEMMETEQMRICRPRQLYDGPELRHVEGGFRPRVTVRAPGNSMSSDDMTPGIAPRKGSEHFDKAHQFFAKTRLLRRGPSLHFPPRFLRQDAVATAGPSNDIDAATKEASDAP